MRNRLRLVLHHFRSTAGPTRAGSTTVSVCLVLKSLIARLFKQHLEYYSCMRNLLALLFLGGLLITNLSAITIDYTLTPLGSGEYQYDYTITGSFNAYEQIDIDFPTAVNLGDPNDSNLSIVGSTDPAWSASIESSIGGGQPIDLQYETSVGETGTPNLAGPFEVEFDYSGSGQPGPQSFTVYQYNGSFTAPSPTIVTTGMTLDSLPEPSGLGLSAMALLAMCACWASRRIRRQAAQ